MSNIIGNLPDNLTNGIEADASQVMANLNFIVNQVNANAVPTSVTSLASLATIGSTALDVQGTLEVDGSSFTMDASNAGQYLGAPASSNTPFLNFYSSGNAGSSLSNFDVRLIASGGSSTPASGTMTCYAAALTCTGNVTAYSDERLKKDWTPFGPDFLERVAGVLHGTYTRTDTGERRVGAGAQTLQGVLREAVFGDDVLSIAEGSAALAIVIELTAEVLRLRALLEPVK